MWRTIVNLVRKIWRSVENVIARLHTLATDMDPKETRLLDRLDWLHAEEGKVLRLLREHDLQENYEHACALRELRTTNGNLEDLTNALPAESMMAA